MSHELKTHFSWHVAAHHIKNQSHPFRTSFTEACPRSPTPSFNNCSNRTMSFQADALDTLIRFKDSIESISTVKSSVSFLTLCATFAVIYANEEARSFVVFIWACFVKPFAPNKNHSDHQNNLEGFYKTQAKVYDTTREILLQGRDSALKIAYAHALANKPQSKKKLVWVDIGGGTGLNIEKMDKNVANLRESFDAIYLIDLSTSLCEVASDRVTKNGWKNVHVICGDACDFEISHQDVDLITFSYSLSMIPMYHSAIDHAEELLNSDTGVICSVDFGVQSAFNSIGRTNTLGGMVDRHVPWLYRTFWRLWFECDNVFLDPSRREYLEYKFGTVKSVNCYNMKLGKIPYYIWVGVNMKDDAQLLYRFNSLATESPYLAPVDPKKSQPFGTEGTPVSKALEAAHHNAKKGLPYPSLFYQRQTWRVYYDELSNDYECFKNQYIYAFTWEDPRADANILKLTTNDTVLAITSAGDNILSYATLPNAPRRIHGVDLNPCQGHLVELKLACLTALSHDQTWKIFGEGKVENFREILISKLSPHMSSNAFQYWMQKGSSAFDLNGKGLYDTGSTRWALRLARYVFAITGLTDTVDKLCSAKTMNEQREIWHSHIRPVLYSAIVGKLFVGNQVFLWKALGVPANQAAMMDTSILQYIIDTLDPVIGNSLLSTDNYFYYLTLKGHYSPTNCPDYLTKQGFKTLSRKQASPLEGIRLHTDYLNNVLRRLSKKTISVAVIMDHMDWFDPTSEEVNDEIDALHGALCEGGRVMLRSAAQVPWYIENFERRGFECTAAATRHSGKMIDRVNMYASTWICKKRTGSGDRKMSTIALDRA